MYEELETPEGDINIVMIAKARDKATKDFTHNFFIQQTNNEQGVANIHISLSSLIRVKTGKQTSFSVITMLTCFLVKLLISLKAYCLGFPTCALSRNFPYLHNVMLSK